MATLAEHLDSALPAPAEREGWQINDDSSAEWALRKLAHLKAAHEADKRLAEAEVERIQAWLTEKQRAYDSEREFFKNHLRSYHMRRFAADPKAKTIRLPHGTLICRKQQLEFARDEAALLAWVKQNRPELVKIKESTDWVALKKRIALTEPEGVTARCVDVHTGEVVEGVTALIRPERFDVEVAENG